MTDFYPLVLRALAKLARNTEKDRQALYQRARTTLAARLQDIDPPVSQQRIMEERLAFEEAVRKAEADWTRGLVERELLSKLADAIEHDSVADLPAPPRDPWTHLSGTLQQARSGARFDYAEGGKFVFASMGTEADRATAADPVVRSIRSELEYKAREVAGRISRMSELAEWRGLIDAVRLFADLIGGPEAEVAADIGTLWALYVALGAYLDFQEPVSSEEMFVPLEADALGAVRDLVAASGPWIGMFPTGRAFEDQARTLGSPPSESVDAATAFLHSAQATALLRDDDATILRAVLDGGGAGRVGEKAENWAIWTASNLAVAMLLVLAGIVRGYGGTSDAAAVSEVARRIERVVIDHEPGLLRVFSHLPDDVRDQLRMAIDAIRASAEDDA